MDQYIKQAIDARKNVFFDSYNISSEKTINNINELFDKIYSLGESCKDITEFESKFSTSELNQEYINMITKVATSPEQLMSDRNFAKEEVDLMKRRVKNDLKEEARKATSDIPIVGDIDYVRQAKDMFNMFRKNKDE